MVDVLQIPRLTGLLRAHYSPAKEKTFDVEQEYIKRDERLRKEQKKREVQGVDDGSASGGRQLTWAYFEAPKSADLPIQQEAKQIQTIYQQFLLLVPKIVGDELSTTELHNSAMFIYEALADDAKSVAAKRERLRNYFATIDNGTFNQASALVAQLAAWRTKVKPGGTDGTTDDAASAEASRQRATSDVEKEFGDDIELAFDSDFLLRAFIDSPPHQAAEAQAQQPSSTASAPAKSKKGRKRGGGGQQAAASADDALAGFGAAPGSAWEGVEKEAMDEDWLANQCERHLQITQGSLSVKELAASILRILSDRSVKTDLQLQDQLFGLLGETSFEFISLLVQRRASILTFYANNKRMVDGGGHPRAAVGGQITVTTEDDKFLRKLQRKEASKRNRRGAAPVLFAEPSIEELLPPGYTPGDYASASSGASKKILLPEGTVRNDTKEYEEVRIPPTKPGVVGEGERLVPISEFDEWARPAFGGIKALNRIQSRVFEAAYRSNENLLICAPTGAGKTNVALMTILHEIGQNYSYGVIRKERFKIIYVAPMKALAQEMVENFSRRLKPLGIVVKELTGDMQLTKKELTETQMIVTTPEKWDVITRKTSDVALVSLVRLLIIDEVHLLHEDRGPVIETLVARTLRQVESSQSMIRIVGLSATLPNYEDVATFLRVNTATGLFHFNNAYRPVPLSQQYIGVKTSDATRKKAIMNRLAYEKAKESVEQGHQVMIFVHSRQGTVKTAQVLMEIAREKATTALFQVDDDCTARYNLLLKEVGKSRNRELKELFAGGFGMHHAGMLRADRNLVEKLFAEGYIRVLCCTATLAWGVNLPAHTVVIKGTDLYDSKKSAFVELGMLDVMQIFGRAGRPQFDTSGEGIIITSHEQLPRYLSLMNHQLPIESQFVNNLADNLNAEIVSGTVTNMDEAVEWLSYTYLFVRMLRNPLAYGITHQQKLMDPMLLNYRQQLVAAAAKTLDEAKMARWVPHAGTLDPTHLGRTASHFYLLHDTIVLFNEKLKASLSDADLLSVVAQSGEFENMKIREEEQPELKALMRDVCQVDVRGGIDNAHGKVNILFQAYLANAPIEAFSLVSDMNYVAQNMGRIFRGLFEICLHRGWTVIAERALAYCKMTDLRVWDTQHPLQQLGVLSPQILYKLITKKVTLDRLADLDAREIGELVGHPKMGGLVKKYVHQFPALELEATVQPITRTVLRVGLTVTAAFDWNDRISGAAEGWWIWVEDPENEHIYHHEYYVLGRQHAYDPVTLTFTIPIFEPLPAQYLVHAVSNRWLHASTTIALSFKHLILPHQYPPHTELLDLQPLPVTALRDEGFQRLYPFTHFNPIQTQIFHSLYHSDHNVLLGAPTGSGKTVAAELAMLRLFREYPHLKAVYIGPLKALVRERMKDWERRLVGLLGKRMVELTGDYTPDLHALQSADIVLTTPEKWDGISRNWQNRGYVKAVGLIVIDEVHLLGQDRGPILEVIVSRMRYIASQTDNPVRLVCLSTAVANARDLADWLGIEGHEGLFNFRPSVRPVPLEAHIQGYPGDHYCPRMATMNKPAYAAIKAHSPAKPVLIFVSSRRQTRLTALDLIAFLGTEDNPRQFLRMPEAQLEPLLARVTDANLRHTLPFGIGLHHAGLTRDDKGVVEELFGANRIQVLISTSTLAWGVNLPAHLVVIKGTEFFDPKTRRYLDFPITDVLQMMGRAGRPQFDTYAKAVIMVHEPKKNFYKKFLYEPFPVESSLHTVLHDHFNAEIVSGTIASKQDAVDYLTWTYYFRRLLVNPAYYDLEATDAAAINRHLSERVDAALRELEASHCLEIDEVDGTSVYPLTFGRIASYYYLHHTTMRLFYDAIGEDNDLRSLLDVLAGTAEYDELPVRHNEDKLNEELAATVPWPVDAHLLDDPHTKTNLLLQAHFAGLALPISDYITDTKSVLDQAVRILQAMVDVAADGGWLKTTLNCMHLMQMVMQARWFTDSTLLTLPHADDRLVLAFADALGVDSLPELLALDEARVQAFLRDRLSARQTREFIQVLRQLPVVDLRATVDLSAAAADKLPPSAKAAAQNGHDHDDDGDNDGDDGYDGHHDDDDDDGYGDEGDEEGEVEEEEAAEGVVKVELSLANKDHSRVAYTPRFTKQKEPAWWVVLGNPDTGELLALRRLTIRPKNRTRTSLTFALPEEEGEYTYWLYLMSDSYLGLDQQIPLTFTV